MSARIYGFITAWILLLASSHVNAQELEYTSRAFFLDAVRNATAPVFYSITGNTFSAAQEFSCSIGPSLCVTAQFKDAAGAASFQDMSNNVSAVCAAVSSDRLVLFRYRFENSFFSAGFSSAGGAALKYAGYRYATNGFEWSYEFSADETGGRFSVQYSNQVGIVGILSNSCRRHRLELALGLPFDFRADADVSALFFDRLFHGSAGVPVLYLEGALFTLSTGVSTPFFLGSRAYTGFSAAVPSGGPDHVSFCARLLLSNSSELLNGSVRNAAWGLTAGISNFCSFSLAYSYSFSDSYADAMAVPSQGYGLYSVGCLAALPLSAHILDLEYAPPEILNFSVRADAGAAYIGVRDFSLVVNESLLFAWSKTTTNTPGPLAGIILYHAGLDVSYAVGKFLSIGYSYRQYFPQLVFGGPGVQNTGTGESGQTGTKGPEDAGSSGQEKIVVHDSYYGGGVHSLWIRIVY